MKKGDTIARYYQEQNFEATVNWVVGEEAGITYLSPPDWKGGAKVINLVEESDWKVIRESVTTFQSSVAQMSEEELRESIDKLRESRMHIPSPRLRSSRVVASDPVSKAFSKLPKEKREALMKKLGIN